MGMPEDLCERALSSEVRVEDGTGLRTGDGGSVGTVVVVVTVVMVVAFCLDSFDVCSAYLTRFDLLCVVAQWTEVPRPVMDIAVDSDPCLVGLVAAHHFSLLEPTFDLSIVFG